MLAKIAFIGIGGGGLNSLNNIIANYGAGVASLAVNRDRRSLEASLASVKVYMKADSEKQVVQAIKNQESTLVQFMKEKNSLIALACMGGITGTYATPIIASLAINMGVNAQIFINMPFYFEGKDRMHHATKGKERLINTGATVISFNNQDLIKTVSPNTPIIDALRISDKEIFKQIDLSLKLI